MKKTALVLFCLAACLVSCKKETVTIKGHVEFADPDFKISLIYRDGHEKDTVACVSLDDRNNYKIKVKVEKPGVYNLACHWWQSVQVWVEDEDMNVDFRGLDTAKIKIKNPPFVAIKGSPKNEVMNELNYNGYRNYQNMIAISQTAYKHQFVSPEEQRKLSYELYEANFQDMKERNAYLMDRYATCTSVLAAISRLDVMEDEDAINQAIDALLAAHPGYQPAIELKEQFAAEREAKLRMMPGQIAPDFSVPSADGKEIGPASFRGKILLIDFWASWCGPCRGEVPYLKQYYEIFKDKGVEFLSVSIDKSEDAWKKAMSEEGMSWPQALAPKAGAEVMDLYQFSGIPFILLLDTEGRIVAKNLRGEKTKQTIEDLLNGIRPEDREKAEKAAAAAAAAPAASMGGMIPATRIKRQ